MSFRRLRQFTAASVVAPSLALSAGTAAVAAAPPAAAVGTAIDSAVGLVSERLALAEDVAGAKWRNRSPIRDAVQAATVVESAVQQGDSRGLPRDYVSAVFTDQIAASESVQYFLHSQWSTQRNPDPAVADLPKLRASLASLTPRILDSLGAVAAAEDGTACRSAADRSTDRQITERGWHDQRGVALRFATSRLCPTATP
ncbi:gamma subclass chorismate mutase AroQ [Tsukamurella strandjordii]|uniref:gamma subclass chorismate mutase AroQ n=1 Tax=Tsukamurella TaxID=2060 RepID=UPI001C7E1624|nr:gamma subclass chorismate mutase AroQ [Tsukamurella sp. TY48]GIZ98718.1 chorismate mutase [Tsukamurella sp. TY48]